ncbi:hypothetical protein [Thermotalea metallivorans]|uniref:DUF4829 domain-containing protein n=1 Tax=Thermotalea metallivorans TaxID=520762 RepID=A0A140L7E8_9FIRM|nr:hypothetical protein [Thermotalea metallivorans]KXG76473.1 hypothetical protein AN619_10040 [Thermotalea metallivorans]
MKKFCLIIAFVLWVIIFGMSMDVERLYPGEDQSVNVYLKAREDEAYFLRIKKEIGEILERQRRSVLQKKVNDYMAYISKGYHDDKTRDYHALREELAKDFKQHPYETLAYQIHLYYPTAEGVWVRIAKNYSVQKNSLESMKGKEIEDLLFVMEKGRWKIKTVKKMSSLI